MSNVAYWPERRLQDVADVIDPNPAHRNPKYVAEGFPFVSTAEFEEPDTISLDTRRRVAESTVLEQEARCRFSPKSIFFSRKGTIGKTRLHPGTRLALLDSLCVINPGELLDERFLLQVLRSPQTATRIDEVVRGVALPQISVGEVRDLLIPTPPLNEQRRIVAKLDALQSRSRRAREALDAVPPLLEKLRQSILDAAFRGDLTKDWRAQNPNPEPASVRVARILDERRKNWEAAELVKLQSKGKTPSDDRWKARYRQPEPVSHSHLRELPDGWCWTTIDAVGELLLGRRRAETEYVVGREGRVLRPYVRVANVREDRLDLSDVLSMPFNAAELELYRLRPGDIILSEGQSAELVGRSATYEGGQDDLCIQATVHRFRALPIATTSAFAQLVFLHHLHSGIFRSAAALTTNIAHLTSERLKPLPFPLPPLQEQSILTNRVRDSLGKIVQLRARSELATHNQSRLEQAILATAFTGELKINGSKTATD